MPESVDERIKRMNASPGARSDPQFEKWIRETEAKNRHYAKNDFAEAISVAAIAGGLAMWAYWSITYALLFAWIAFSVFVVGNRVIGHMRREKFDREKDAHLDRLYGPADV